MTDRQWRVPATVVRVHDGDTIVADLDLGWHVKLRAAIRIDGIAAPELDTDAGKASRDYLADLLPAGETVEVVSKKLLGTTEKYGRVLADVAFAARAAQRPIAGSVAVAMVAAGHAKQWDGRGRQPA